MIPPLPQNKYAVIMTSTWGLSPGVNAILNGLEIFGTKDIDVYLINDYPQSYFTQAQAFNFPVFDIKFAEMKRMVKLPDHKRSGWQVRFWRWLWARKIADSYKTMLVLDADMAVTNNLSEYFRMAEETGKLIMVQNPIGYSLEFVKERGPDVLRGAATPPFHCMPTFFDARKYKGLLDQIWQIGINLDYGDMSSLFRAVIKENLIDQIVPLDNNYWIQTIWYFEDIERKDGRLFFRDKPINSIHGRWWIPSICAKAEGIKEKDLIDIGRRNARLLWETYRDLNTKYKVKLDYKFQWYQDL